MLQQTQVSRVEPVYRKFITKYPDVRSLSKATKGDVLRAWKGMGYNRRALYLLSTAIKIVNLHNGIFPKTQKELTQFPGLGIYTARAIMVFAYKKDIAAVDVNIKKIITKYFFNDRIPTYAEIQHVADQLVPSGKSWQWHQALMDYGSLEMTKQIHKNTPSPLKKHSVPFRKSKRYIRGKIIDILRIHSIRKDTLMEKLLKMSEKSEEEIIEILTNLRDEGLISIKGNIVELPV